eukprot:m.73466 g.73466  ORF g.73466 m.73466 type:complete len:59 (+) comp7723_c1_seq1:389-565(+)
MFFSVDAGPAPESEQSLWQGTQIANKDLTLCGQRIDVAWMCRVDSSLLLDGTARLFML